MKTTGWKSRLDTLRRDPWGAVRRRAHYRLYCRRSRRFWQRQPLLAEFLAGRPPEAFPPDYADLLFLYETVLERRPRTILEFGSGCSTLAMALALRDLRESGAPAGRLISIDSDERWAASTERALPPSLRGFCRVLHRPAAPERYNGTPVLRHADLPEVEPDLVYLDGPPLEPGRQVAVDVLDLEDRFPPGFLLIVDGRWVNCMFLKEHLQRPYRFHYRTLFQNSTFELLTEAAR